MKQKLKTIRFVREPNTFNEYTCDQYDDCTGDYINKEDLINEIRFGIADSDTADADFILLHLLSKIE